MVRALILLLLLAGSAQAQDAAVLRARHAALKWQLANNPFGRPLHVESSASGGAHKGQIYAVIEQPYRVVAPALARPADWCQILTLQVNILCGHLKSGQSSTGQNRPVGEHPKHESSIASPCDYARG
jgi:hypothetical protein